MSMDSKMTPSLHVCIYSLETVHLAVINKHTSHLSRCQVGGVNVLAEGHWVIVSLCGMWFPLERGRQTGIWPIRTTPDPSWGTGIPTSWINTQSCGGSGGRLIVSFSSLNMDRLKILFCVPYCTPTPRWRWRDDQMQMLFLPCARPKGMWMSENLFKKYHVIFRYIVELLVLGHFWEVVGVWLEVTERLESNKLCEITVEAHDAVAWTNRKTWEWCGRGRGSGWVGPRHFTAWMLQIFFCFVLLFFFLLLVFKWLRAIFLMVQERQK